MTGHREADDLKALASDPTTDWGMLHWIAENHPELRPAVAGNPGTYQELVDALGELGDAEIDAAIAQRHRGRDVSSEAAAANPMAGMWDTATHHIPAYSEEHDDDASARTAATPEEAVPAPVPVVPLDDAPEAEAEAEAGAASATVEEAGATDELGTVEPSAVEPAATGESSAVDEPIAAGEPNTAGEFSTPEESEALVTAESGTAGDEPVAAGTTPPPPVVPADSAEDSRKRRPALMVGLVLVVVGALVGAVAIFAALNNSDEPGPVASPSPSPTASEPEEEPEEEEAVVEEDEEDEPEEEEPAQDLDALRAAVAALPEDSSCEIGDEAGPLADFLNAVATDSGSLSGEDEDMLADVFEELQTSCNASHAAGLFEAVRSGDQAPDEGGQLLSAVSTAWVNQTVATPDGAQTIDGFTAQDGDVVCEFTDGLRCTFYDQADSAPGTCDGPVTYRIQAGGGNAEPDCDNPVDQDSDYSVLSVDDAATDGFLACRSLEDRVSCFNTLNANGFEMSSTDDYAY